MHAPRSEQVLVMFVQIVKRAQRAIFARHFDDIWGLTSGCAGKYHQYIDFFFAGKYRKVYRNNYTKAKGRCPCGRFRTMNYELSLVGVIYIS